MRKWVVLGLIGLLALAGGVVALLAGRSSPPSTGWSDASEVPGLAALNNGGGADIGPISCAAADNCAAAGSYHAGPEREHAFVVDERNGSWGDAIGVPGMASLGRGNSYVHSISCATTGNCAVSGELTFDGEGGGAFVADETNGSWGNAVKVTGTGFSPTVPWSISCATAGDCTVGGFYYTRSGDKRQAFVADETNGSWDNAIEVPGTATLNSGGYASVESVSCAAAGYCTAGGDYLDGDGSPGDHSHAFVVDKTNGSWETALQVPGLAALNRGDAYVTSVSCATPGNCAAIGSYENGSGVEHAFVVNETNGDWGNAIEVPGTNVGASVESVSCATPGNCTVGGSYPDRIGNTQAFVAEETNGKWGKAMNVPGTVTLNGGGVSSVSCPTPHTCAAAGGYTDDSGRPHGFVVIETHGSWGNASEVPGAAAKRYRGRLRTGGGVHAVSCAAPHNCAATGGYGFDSSATAFLVNYQSP